MRKPSKFERVLLAFKDRKESLSFLKNQDVFPQTMGARVSVIRALPAVQ